MMTNIATFEDVMESILGLVLGASAGQYELATSGSGGGKSGGKSSINDGFRPSTIKGPGFWLIAQRDTLKHTGQWAPEYDKDAVTFYKWQDVAAATKDITRLTVWVGVVNRDNAQGQGTNTNDPNAVVNASANPVIALGQAWELLLNEIPAVAGAGTPFDPNTIEALRQIFSTLATHASDISGALTTDVTSVNAKSPDFTGSAESAWYHRVLSANHYFSDLGTQQAAWDSALAAVSKSMTAFIKSINDAMSVLENTPPKNTWHNPYRLIAAMFNDGSLAMADVKYDANGHAYSDAWDLGSQYADTGGNGNNTDPYWFTPDWMSIPAFNAFDPSGWNNLDAYMRQQWATKMVNVFSPVVTAAKDLVTTFSTARNELVLADPAPVPPLPMPNTLGMPNDPYANIGNPFANIGNPFANIGNPFANIGNPFANIGNPFANIGNPFANVGNPFANIRNPFANVGGGGGNNPFANVGGGGGNNPFANTGGDNVFLKSANPFANGSGPGDTFGAGNANPFANSPLLARSALALPNGPDSGIFTSASPFTGGDGVHSPFANSPDVGLAVRSVDPLANDGGGSGFGGGSGLGGGGGLNDGLGDGPGGTPQTLGDLTPAQLQQLDQAGLLDNVPLTPQQEAFLQTSGLGMPSGSDPTLGQLTPKQLSALQKAGLLDQTPITSAERAALGLSAATASGSKLAVGSGLPVESNPFPTTVDGVDVSSGPKLAGGSGMTLGDVTKAGATTHPTIPGLAVSTGGLSGMPAMTGKAGGLSTAGTGLTVGSGLGSGAGAGLGDGSGVGSSGVGSSGIGGSGIVGSGLPGAAGVDGGVYGTAGSGAGAGAADSGLGGMPYMPGMMGGGGQGKKDRERARNTWLKEDEKVWGTDPDCPPAVVGRRDRSTRIEDDEYTPETDERPGTQDERRPYRGR